MRASVVTWCWRQWWQGAGVSGDIGDLFVPVSFVWLVDSSGAFVVLVSFAWFGFRLCTVCIRACKVHLAFVVTLGGEGNFDNHQVCLYIYIYMYTMHSLGRFWF